MYLSELYSGMDRDPDEQQHIVEEMTALIAHDPTNAQAYFRRGNALSNLRRLCAGQAGSGQGDRAGAGQRPGL